MAATRDPREAIEAASRALPPGMEDGAGAFTGLFVRRPVLALVVNLLIIVAGLAALVGAEVRELPDIDQPAITVTTFYEGAAPATIDAEVTEVIEGAAARVPGVKAISSSSRFGRSQVTIEFNDETSIDAAASDLRDSLSRVRNNLPEETEEPRIVKADANADDVIRVALTSDRLPIADLTRLAQNEVLDGLSSVAGVADVQVRGEREPVLFIDIDQVALAGRGLDIGDIATLVAAVSGETPAGTLTSRTQDLVVRADSRLTRPEQFAALMLDGTTRLGDVARVFYGPDTRSTVTRTDRRTGIGFGIIRQAGSNTLDLSRAVRAEVDRLNLILPEGTELRVVSDEAIFVRGAIQ
ncbi:MAG TPA: efflux RND transporter permease subunit, partial [Paracoccaceae bacterium]|nr:efflux RND transporter permease subunit [Paracoccaceae bacterium]